MAFTYTEDLTNNRDFIRFHTGDTDSASSFLSDAIITSLLAKYSTPEAATLEALRYIITKLSTPNFKADWLQVDTATARAGYEGILAEKKNEFGIGGLTVSVTNVYRADSAATEEPDFTDGRPGGGDSASNVPGLPF